MIFPQVWGKKFTGLINPKYSEVVIDYQGEDANSYVKFNENVHIKGNLEQLKKKPTIGGSIMEFHIDFSCAIN